MSYNLNSKNGENLHQSLRIRSGEMEHLQKL